MKNKSNLKSKDISVKGTPAPKVSTGDKKYDSFVRQLMNSKQVFKPKK